jgi:hypothetical protein
MTGTTKANVDRRSEAHRRFDQSVGTRTAEPVVNVAGSERGMERDHFSYRQMSAGLPNLVVQVAFKKKTPCGPM